MAPEVARAWRLLLSTGGTVPVAGLAQEVGWSRRHLAERFRAEIGLGLKEAARVVRFDRARRMLQRLADAERSPGQGRDGPHDGPRDRPPRDGPRDGRRGGGRPDGPCDRPRTFADVAAECGYYDQAHLAREFGALAGCPPSALLAEELPNVQAAEETPPARLTA
jgi:AraC-like DNA-binding protein